MCDSGTGFTPRRHKSKRGVGAFVLQGHARKPASSMYQSVSSRTLWPELCYSVVSYPANRNRFFSLKHDAIKLYFRSLVLDSSPTNMISILSYVRIVFVVVRFYPRRLTLSEPRSSSQENWALILYRRESGKRYLYFQILTRRITFTN